MFTSVCVCVRSVLFLELHIESDVLFLFILVMHLNPLSGFENQSQFFQFSTKESFLFLIRNVLYCVYM